jgi:hypothetical protein
MPLKTLDGIFTLFKNNWDLIWIIII